MDVPAALDLRKYYSACRFCETQYSACVDRTVPQEKLLLALGQEVRSLRVARGRTLKELSASAEVSERFLSDVEAGRGNISIARLDALATALGTSASSLLARAEAVRAPRARPVVSLLGLRGAGKSSVGARLADLLGVPFVELDVQVAEAAGMSLATIFEIHGEAWFRRLERETLRRLLERAEPAVVATGGSIVTDAETFALLRSETRTVWLRAAPKEHWDRVVAQGDGRPMRGRANAMNELRSILARREPLYAAADHELDTSRATIDDAAQTIAGWVR